MIRFGVATAGFQVEGGYNGPGQPANNWHAWEASGRAEPSGPAVEFWDRWADHLDRAAAAGCDAFRLSVEWARVEPAEGSVDTTALDRYAAILDGCRERGLEPVVTLHHFTHPEWLGEEFWLRPDAPERFLSWVELAVDRLGSRCDRWVTINEINVLSLLTYVLGKLPPGRRGAVGAAVRCSDHLLAAHVLAYGAIKARHPWAVVSTNDYCMSVYELDRLGIDLLLARRNGVDRYDLHPWLSSRRDDFHQAVGVVGRRERLVRRTAESTILLEKAFPRAISEVYATPHECTLDTVQIDYYAPYVGGALRLPGHRTAGGRSWEPARALWDDPVDPNGLTRFTRLNTEPGLPVEIIENGLCNRVVDGVTHPRRDSWTRERYLVANLAAVVDAIDAGLPVASYFHWTLADNYEWGSYEPRFGLHGVDRTNGVRVLDVDSMGDDAAGTYRRIVERLRDGDRSVVGR